MILSPPFLPARSNDAEDAWLARAMLSPDHGAYPVSNNLAWHGGLHLIAPTEGTQVLPVRAIADGTVVYVRGSPNATPMPLDPEAASKHALGYNGWTSDGVVVVRHDTEIGADAQGTATAVRFFSIYMHLASVLPAVRINQPIHRKAEIGVAGFFEGQAGVIHFEIICDDDNLQRLIGRATGDVPLGADGRTDAVFGDLHFQLPATLPVHATRPALNQPAPAGGTPLGEDLFVGIRYDSGEAQITTYRADGKTLGAALSEAEAEYHLYRDAGAIVAAYRAANAASIPSHSAVYELLRFGRVINTAQETLSPVDTPHWRQIRTPTGQGWVNLNATGVFKFSDADAPHWSGWRLSEDYQDGDSRCDLPTIRTMLDEDGDGVTTAKEAETKLKDATVQAALRRVIGKFPTEWQRSAVVRRWHWLTNEGAGGGTGFGLSAAPYLTQTDFPDFQRHAEALCFWEDANLGIDAAHWHFNPREFIQNFRRCAWLSKAELARVYPDSKYPATALATEGRGRTPETVRENYRIEINKVTRKYMVNTAVRMTHFYGQGAVESMFLCLMIEGSANFSRNPGHASFQPETNDFYVPARANDYLFYLENRLGNIDAGDGPKFRGRGMKQLTGRENYSKYWVYRGWLDQSTFTTPWWNPARPARAPQISNPQELSTNSYSAIDAGGWYWQSGAASNQFNTINTVITNNTIDRTSVRAVARAINGVNRNTGDPNGLAERLLESQRIEIILMDKP